MWAAAEGHADGRAGADRGRRRFPRPPGLRLHAAAVRRPRRTPRRRSRAAEGGRRRQRDRPGRRARRRGYGGRLPPAGASAAAAGGDERALRAGGASCSTPAPIPNADLHRLHRRSTRSPRSASRASATTIRRPKDRAAMTSLELVKKLAARGANVNARMTKTANLNNTRANEIGATPFFLAALTADAELMKTLAALGADPRLTERREQHAADGRGRPRHALARRGRRHRERSAGGRAGGARLSAPTSTPSTTTARPRCTPPPTRTCRRS